MHDITLAKLVTMANPLIREANTRECEENKPRFKHGLRWGPPAAASHWLEIHLLAPSWPAL